MSYSRTRIFSWSLYDFANTMFSMNVVSLNFPLMIKSVYGGEDINLSIARSSAMVLVALTMPLAGVVADKFRRRMPLAIALTLSCCLATMSLGRGGSMTVQLAIFAVAVFSYQGALVFYNAVLPQVAGLRKMGRVSGYGVALGYTGTIFGLIVVGSLCGAGCYSDTFTLTALLFLLFALPFFFTVRDETPGPFKKVISTVIDSIRNIADVFRDARSRTGVLRLLAGRFFVVEALETVIFFMAVFLKEAAGFSDKEIIIGNLNEITVFLVVVTVFTAVGSFIWGFICEKIGPRNALLGTVILWIITLGGIILLKDKNLFYLFGSLAGIALGGVWTVERPLLINLVGDNEKLAEYFGLFALSGRMAAVIGPIIWGLTVLVFGALGAIKYRFAVGSVLIMMVAGFFVLRKVPDAR
ncbi:MAG: MFS transporter [Candidatus Zixiibacteriota bacterium]|nr:MAG: MFS transporter [candidate division Zixibacteria bacterium]